MRAKSQREQVEFEAGRSGYYAGQSYTSFMPAEWRKGWIAAQREKLQMRSRQPPAQLPLGAPVVDVAALERKRMGRR